MMTLAYYSRRLRCNGRLQIRSYNHMHILLPQRSTDTWDQLEALQVTSVCVIPMSCVFGDQDWHVHRSWQSSSLLLCIAPVRRLRFLRRPPDNDHRVYTWNLPGLVFITCRLPVCLHRFLVGILLERRMLLIVQFFSDTKAVYVMWLKWIDICRL